MLNWKSMGKKLIKITLILMDDFIDMKKCKFFDFEGASFCSIWFLDKDPDGCNNGICKNPCNKKCSHFNNKKGKKTKLSIIRGK